MILVAPQVRTEGGSFLSADVYFLSKVQKGRYRAEAKIETIGGRGAAGKSDMFVRRDIGCRMRSWIASLPKGKTGEHTLFFDTRTTCWNPECVSTFTTVSKDGRESSFGAAFGPRGRLRFRDMLRPGTNVESSFVKAVGSTRGFAEPDRFYATDAGLTWIAVSGGNTTYVKARWSDIVGALPKYGGRILPGDRVARISGTADLQGASVSDWIEGDLRLSLVRRRRGVASKIVSSQRISGTISPAPFSLLFDLPKGAPGDTFEIVGTLRTNGVTRFRSKAMPVANPGWRHERSVVLVPL